MKYGYTIADAASREIFERAVTFIIEELHYRPEAERLEDVDGSIQQKFIKDDAILLLESDAQVDYVGIISDVKLPIKCLHEFTC